MAARSFSRAVFSSSSSTCSHARWAMFFPELRKKHAHVREVLHMEEEAFNRTLDTGIKSSRDLPRRACGGDRVSRCRRHGGGVSAHRTAKGIRRAFPCRNFSRSVAREIPGFRPEEPARALWPVGLRTLRHLWLPDRPDGAHCPRAWARGGSRWIRKADGAPARTRPAGPEEGVISVSSIEAPATKFFGYDSEEIETRVIDVVGIKDKTAVILESSVCYAENGRPCGRHRAPHPWRKRAGRFPIPARRATTWLHFISVRKSRNPARMSLWWWIASGAAPSSATTR